MKSLLLGALLGMVVGWFGSLWFSQPSSSPKATVPSTTPNSLLEARGSKEGSDWLPSSLLSSQERLLALAYRSTKTPQAAFRKRLHELITLQNDAFRSEAFAQLMQDWVEHDPHTAFEACIDLPKSAPRDLLLDDVLESWALIDLESALDKARTLPNDFYSRDRLIASLLTTLSETDPERALELIDAEEMVGGHLSGLYASIAKADPELAIGRLADSTDFYTWKGVLPAWIEMDADAAITHLASQRQLHSRLEYLFKDVMPTLLADEPERIQELLQSSLPPHSWQEICGAFAQAWFEKDPQAAVSWVKSVEDDDSRDAMTAMVGEHLAEKSPEAAFRYVHEQGLPANLQKISETWGKKNWSAAFEHVISLQTAPTAQAHAASGLLASSPPSMDTNQIRQLLELTESQGLRANVSGLLPDLSIEEIRALVAAYPTSLASEVKSYTEILVQHDPHGAAELMTSLPGNEVDDVGVMVAKWSANDPESAEAWLATLPEGENRHFAYLTHMDAMARSHPAQALDALDQLPEDLQRSAIRNYIKIVSDQSPSAGLDAALTTQDSELIETTMGNWHRLQPDQALKRLPGFQGELREAIEKRFESNDQWRALGNPN